MRHETFPVGALGCNCTVAVCTETGDALVVDPGDDAETIVACLRRLGARTVVKVVHTHAHADHVLAAEAVAQPSRAEILVHPGDRWLWDHVAMQAGLFGWQVTPPGPPTGTLADDQTLDFGRLEARVLHTPGHTPGSVCFVLPGEAAAVAVPNAEPTTVPNAGAGAAPLLLSGDTLFHRSVGRTDLWGTSFEELARSIRERLFTLPAETVVIPGHGPATTIGAERELNPFVGRRAAT